jgi:nucleotide-binding universal stress UspA family protein
MSAEFNNIIVPVDGSESSQRAARFAIDLSKATGSKVTFVYVFPDSTSSVGGFDFMGMLHPERGDIDIEQAKKEIVRKVFDKTHQAIGGEQQNIEKEILVGDPAKEIIRYLNEHPNTMTVIGRRGLSGFEALLLGSVSEKVMRHSSGPITIVP